MNVVHIFREKLKIPTVVVDQIIKGTGTDIRQVLNLLSSWTLIENSINYNQGLQLIKSSEKDVSSNMWDAAIKLFDPVNWLPNSNLKLDDKLDLYFHEPEFVPLMIQVLFILVGEHTG